MSQPAFSPSGRGVTSPPVQTGLSGSVTSGEGNDASCGKGAHLAAPGFSLGTERGESHAEHPVMAAVFGEVPSPRGGLFRKTRLSFPFGSWVRRGLGSNGVCVVGSSARKAHSNRRISLTVSHSAPPSANFSPELQVSFRISSKPPPPPTQPRRHPEMALAVSPMLGIIRSLQRDGSCSLLCCV